MYRDHFSRLSILIVTFMGCHYRTTTIIRRKKDAKNTQFSFHFCLYVLLVCSTIYSNYLGHMVKGFNFVTDHSLPYSHSQSRIHKQQKAKRRRNITAIYDGLFIIV